MYIKVKFDALNKMKLLADREMNGNDELQIQIDIFPTCRKLDKMYECYIGASLCIDGEYVTDLEQITNKTIISDEMDIDSILGEILDEFMIIIDGRYSENFINIEHYVMV